MSFFAPSNIRALFYALLGSSLSACGGGAVHVSAMNPDLRPAFGVIRELEQSSSSEEFDKHLADLHGLKGDRLNWEDFWTLLSQSPAKSVAVNRHKDRLLSLQGRDCSVVSYRAYARFIAAAGQGYEYLYDPAKRICSGSLDAPLVLELSQQAWRKRAEKDEQIGSFLIAWLSHEMDNGDRKEWESAFTLSEESKVIALFDDSIEQSSVSANLLFLKSARRLIGRVPFPTYLRLTFFGSDSSVLKRYLAQEQLSEVCDLLDMIVPSEPTDLNSFLDETPPTNLDLVAQTLASLKIGNKSESWETVTNRYQTIRGLINRTHHRQPFAKRTEISDRLYLSLFKWAEHQPQHLAIEFLTQSVNHSANTARNLDLLWVMHSVVGSEVPRDIIVRRLRNLSTEGLTTWDRVVVSRLRYHLAATNEEKKVALGNYCKAMDENGLPTSQWTAEQFEAHIADSRPLSAGCHQIDTVLGQPTNIHVRTPIAGATDTVLRFVVHAPFSLKAPLAQVGAIVLHPTAEAKVAEVNIDERRVGLTVFSDAGDFTISQSSYRTVPFLVTE